MFWAVLLILIYHFFLGLVVGVLDFRRWGSAQAWGVVILFDALHVIGFGVMAQAQAWGVGELPQSWGTAQASGVGKSSEGCGTAQASRVGRSSEGWRNCSGFRGGAVIGGVRAQGVGSSGEWGRVAPGPDPQQIGEHVQGCGRVQSLRCARVGECANVQGCGNVQSFGHVQMCKGLEVCRGGACANVQRLGCARFRECANV